MKAKTPVTKNPPRTQAGSQPQSESIEELLRSAMAGLERHATRENRDGLARYGIVTADKTLGVPINAIQTLARTLGRNHELAAALWETRCYEARLLASFVDDPAQVTPAQMDAWCRDFDNWGICDTVCFHLFDRTPHAMRKVKQWAGRSGEFQKRTAFALLACVALHDKKADDQQFFDSLALVEAASADDRNFVKKGLSWALRAIAGRSAALKAAVIDLAKRLAASSDSGPRWLGKDVLRQLKAGA